MARQLVVLALLFAVGIVSAAETPAASPANSPNTEDVKPVDAKSVPAKAPVATSSNSTAAAAPEAEAPSAAADAPKASASAPKAKVGAPKAEAPASDKSEDSSPVASSPSDVDVSSPVAASPSDADVSSPPSPTGPAAGPVEAGAADAPVVADDPAASGASFLKVSSAVVVVGLMFVF